MLMAFVTSISLVAKEPSQGFLNGAYAKMMAQSKMIDFAKTTPRQNLLFTMGVSLCAHQQDRIPLCLVLLPFIFTPMEL